MPSITLVIESNLDNVRLAALAVNKLCADYFAEQDVCSIELGVVEALTNIVKHSYRDNPAGEISVHLVFKDYLLNIRIQDSGLAIDTETVDITGGDAFDYDPNDQKNLPEGGLGLALIHNSMDDVKYETRDGVNTMTLTKVRRLG